MGLEEIVNVILKEAKEEAQNVLTQALKEKEEKEKSFEEFLSKKLSEEKNIIRNKFKEELRQKLIAKRLEFEKEILKLKHEALENVYKDAIENFLKDKSAYVKWFKKTLIDNLTTKNETVYIGEVDKNTITAEFINEINKEIRCNLKISPDFLPLRGGFVLKTDRIEIDNSIDSFLKLLKEKSIIKIAKIIFEE